jgi:erythromycin esterase-like protein
MSIEYRLQKDLEEMAKQSKNSVANIELQLYEKGKAIAMLTENDSINKEAIASLSDQLDELMGEIDNGLSS